MYTWYHIKFITQLICIFLLQHIWRHTRPNTQLGTAAYIAPEILVSKEYDGQVGACHVYNCTLDEFYVMCLCINWHTIKVLPKFLDWVLVSKVGSVDCSSRRNQHGFLHAVLRLRNGLDSVLVCQYTAHPGCLIPQSPPTALWHVFLLWPAFSAFWNKVCGCQLLHSYPRWLVGWCFVWLMQ